jgi:hypothetical protein
MAGLFACPYARPVSASQAREPDRDAPASCLRCGPATTSCGVVRRIRLTLTDYRPLLLPLASSARLAL